MLKPSQPSASTLLAFCLVLLGLQDTAVAHAHAAHIRRPTSARATQPPRPQAPQPAAVLQLDPALHHVLIADTTHRRLDVWTQRAGRLEPWRSLRMSIGAGGAGKAREGDQRTPLGLYRIVGLRQGALLPPDYGPLALVLDYPNAFDRTLGRTGSDIWLHGGPGAAQAVPKRSSTGCLVLGNADLLALRNLLGSSWQAGRTAVLITPTQPLSAPAALATRRRAARALVTQWQRAMLRNDARALRLIYSPGALAERGVAPPPVTLQALSILALDANTWVALFEAGDGVTLRHHTQTWQRQEGQWRLVSEGVTP